MTIAGGASRILEHHGKDLLRRHGVPVPRSEAAATPAAAAAAARKLGGAVVIKALVPANRRAHAGGVRFAADPEGAASAGGELLGSSLAGSAVAAVLVEERIEIERELFLAFLVDTERGLPVALASVHGGVDIEDMGTRSPDAISTLELDPWGRGCGHRLHALWGELGLSGRDLLCVAELSERAARVFFAEELKLLELNPIALVTDSVERALAVGALLAVDHLALARHPELAAVAVAGPESWRPPTGLELQALEVAAREPYRGTARFIELKGEIGLLVGGGGGSLVFFDAVRRAGGRPACYTEIGGNPSAEKVRGLTRVVLSIEGVEGLLVGHNITNNTQVDLVAEGVVAGLADLGLDPRSFPVVAREVGTHDQRGRAIFEAAGVEYLGEDATLDAAARRIVERVRSAPAVAR
jgi:succinyl-CoA synthetase beta subunit